MSSAFLSIICAIHNSEDTLDRMLESIIAEEMHPDDFEIIACDDCSTDSSLELLHEFRRKHLDLHMSILRTAEDSVHCPSNTRQYGLSNASGEWVRFIDGDDTLCNHGCIKFFKYIDLADTDKVMVKSEVNQVSSDQTFIQKLSTNTTLLHGNFYNRRFLLSHEISFKPDMKLFEDMYFNSSYISSIFYFGHPEYDFGYLDEVTYNWTHNPSSLSADIFNQCKGHVEIHLIDDWIQGSFMPFEKYLHIWPVPHIQEFKNRVRQIAVDLYYYYENAIYRQKSDGIDEIVLRKAEKAIEYFLKKVDIACRNAFRCDMMQMLKEDPQVFCNEYFSVTSSNNYFVPEHSLEEFIRMMSCESLLFP